MSEGGAGLERAGRLATEVLAPAAAAVEAEGLIPDGHWEALAEAGLFGPFAPAELDGAGLSAPQVWLAIEILASGCLATTFVLIQHFGLLRSLLDPTGPASLRDQHLADLVRGRRRAGIALGGLLADGSLRAARTAGGWFLDGASPWVTGWGYVDLLEVAARTEDDQIARFVLSPDHAGLVAQRQELSAVDASHTVRLEFHGSLVPSDQLISLRPHDPAAALSEGLRPNGSLALGLVRRAIRLAGPAPLDEELVSARHRLDSAGPAEQPAARAAASLLALRAATLVGVEAGSASVRAGSEADRLLREALFTLVFGSRPAIKAALRAQLGP